MRDMSNSILISTSYNPLFSGIPKYMPEFGELTFRDIRGVTCMSQTQGVISVNGYSVDNITGPVRFDNVHFDNIGPQATSVRFADVYLGPGEVNFELNETTGARVIDEVEPGSSTPHECRFPTLPTPEGMPEDWVW